MKHINKIFIVLILIIITLSGCTNSFSKKPSSIDVNSIKFNYEFLNKNYPDYEHIFKANMYSTSKLYNEIFTECNKNRDKNNYLKFNTDLTVIAGVRALEIAETGCFEDTRPNGMSFLSLYKEYNFDTDNKKPGEVIGYNYETVKELFNAWKEDTENIKKITDPEYSQVGISISITEEGEYVFVLELI